MDGGGAAVGLGEGRDYGVTMRTDSAMQVTVGIAEDIARGLVANAEGLAREALEALAVEGDHSGNLTTEQVRRLPGYSTRYEANGFLKDIAFNVA